jgi:hypothetical protein
VDGQAFAPHLSRPRVHFVHAETKTGRALGVGRHGRPGAPIEVEGRSLCCKSSSSTRIGPLSTLMRALRIPIAAPECASAASAAWCERA